MGCTGSGTFKSEEQGIVRAENALGFSKVDAKRVDYIIRKFSFNQKVCLNHLERISSALSIHIENYGVNNNISEFFYEWMDENHEIPMNELLLMGLLHSKGDPKVKAKLIFQVYSRNEKMDTSKAESLIREIVSISLKTGDLVCDDQSDYSNEIKSRKYIDDLSKLREEATQRTTKSLGTDIEVSEDDFVDVLCRDNGRLLRATGWRSMLSRISTSVTFR